MALNILLEILKVFYRANHLFICPFLKENEGLTPWIQMFKVLLDMPVPDPLEAATDDMEEVSDRDSNIIWKVKAEAARITFKLFIRYANLKFMTERDDIAYNKYFQ